MITKKIIKAIDSFKRYRLRLKINIPIHPDIISILSIIISFLVFYNAILTLLVVLFLDLLGGAVARARGLTSYRGQVSDWLSDRCSEFIIFGYFALSHKVFLIFPIINIVLNMLVVKNVRIGNFKFYILPIRQILVAILIGMLIVGWPL